MVKGVSSISSSSSANKSKSFKSSSSSHQITNKNAITKQPNATPSKQVLEKKLQTKHLNVLVVKSKKYATSADGVPRYTDIVVKLVVTNMVAGDREIELFNGERPFYGGDVSKNILNMDNLISYQLPSSVLLQNLEHRNHLIQKSLKYICPLDLYQALPLSVKGRKAIPSLIEDRYEEVNIEPFDVVFSFIISPADGLHSLENSRRLKGKLIFFYFSYSEQFLNII
jgi:hypothetical protein